MIALLATIHVCITTPDYRPFAVYNDAHQSIVRVVQTTTTTPRQIRYLKLWKPIAAGKDDDVSAELVGKGPDTRVFRFVLKNGTVVASRPVDPSYIRAMRVSDHRVTVLLPTPRPKKP